MDFRIARGHVEHDPATLISNEGFFNPGFSLMKVFFNEGFFKISAFVFNVIEY